jgi:hypothetical protein
LHKSGPQPGFIVVLEQIPANAKFDKEAREQLLDIFRDAADYWGDRKDTRSDVSILFCSPFCTHQPSRTGEQRLKGEAASRPAEGIELMPPKAQRRCQPDKCWVDVSPLALRMSSPFNAGYWLTAA